MKKLLGGRTKRDNKQYDHHLIRLRKKDSESYASKISQQEIFLPIIPGWRSKQRYFRRNINKQVIDTLSDNNEVFKDAIEELDQKLNPTSHEDDTDTEPILLPPPTAEKQNH